MDDKKRIEVRNYAAIHHEEGKHPYRVVTDSDGKETGIRIEGYLTTWDSVNYNGQSWESTAYDENVKSYFEGNGINIPLDLMHCRDLSHLAGVVEVCEKDEHGLRIEAFVTAGCEKYSSIKALMDCGAIQGFSNYGYLTDWDFDEEGNLVVKSFVLISASLVDVPADVGGKFVENYTKWRGFEEKRKEGKETTPNIYGLSF